MRMSEFDHESIRARADAATAGPWTATTSEATMNDRSQWRIGHTQRPLVLITRMSASDAYFIAAARSDIPALLAELEVAAEKVNRLVALALDCGADEGIDEILALTVDDLTPEED